MKKYKISKKNLKEFFGLFGKERTPEKIQKLIDSDPVLQKLNADIKKINNKYEPHIDKLKKTQPKLFKQFQDVGLISKDY